MRHRYLTASLVALAVVLTACGAQQGATGTPAETSAEAADGGQQAAAELDCRAIDFIVPYSPGGGSDRQVRRLQPYLEEALGTSINVTYQTGGDGSVGWLALSNAAADGCTVGNVVLPNIVLLSVTGEDVGFSWEDFQYIAWTETSGVLLTVPAESEFQTVDDFVAAAEGDPGGITVAGSGQTGELLNAQMTDATGIEVAYVPVGGGVGDIVPQLLGGQVDAGMLSSAAVADQADALRPLAISGSETLSAFPDTPTFEEAGYEGVDLTYAWGVAAPPGTPEPIVQAWNDVVLAALENAELRDEIQAAGLEPLQQTPQEANEFIQAQAQAVDDALASVDLG
jgi:tripartite-type tricarboxylate transporter receptor subunit TctC